MTIDGESAVALGEDNNFGDNTLLLVYSPLPYPDWPETLTLETDPTVPMPVCFAAGTPIATPDGERPVEALGDGDLVITADGRAVPVAWVGRQTLHKAFTAEERFRPVRVGAGALAEGVPHTDLVVTPDHGLSSATC